MPKTKGFSVFISFFNNFLILFWDLILIWESDRKNLEQLVIANEMNIS